MKARVLVFPRREVLDPQAKAIHQALSRLGFDDVAAVHAGKAFEIELTADAAAAPERIRAMCDQLLANPIMETWAVEWVEGEAAAPPAKAAKTAPKAAAPKAAAPKAAASKAAASKAAAPKAAAPKAAATKAAAPRTVASKAAARGGKAKEKTK